MPALIGLRGPRAIDHLLKIAARYMLEHERRKILSLRALGNRLVGILHGCLRHYSPYDEHTAWAHRTPTAA